MTLITISMALNEIDIGNFEKIYNTFKWPNMMTTIEEFTLTFNDNFDMKDLNI